jgi:membrane protein implicated in regulation of membrane protease activity
VLTLSDDDGQVKLSNGETWTARFAPESTIRILQPGERVLVTAIDGSTAVVVPAERTTP